MKLFAFAAVFAVSAGLSAPTVAATPIVSGKYLVTWQQYCQDISTGWFGPAGIGTIGPIYNLENTNPGQFSSGVYVADFDPGTATVTAKGGSASASALVLNVNAFPAQPSQGVGASASPFSGTWSFSNTAASFTINANELTAVYGHLKNGVAQSFKAVGTYSGTCVVTFEAEKP